jgi:hypothetical protein
MRREKLGRQFNMPYSAEAANWTAVLPSQSCWLNFEVYRIEESYPHDQTPRRPHDAFRDDSANRSEWRVSIQVQEIDNDPSRSNNWMDKELL